MLCFLHTLNHHSSSLIIIWDQCAKILVSGATAHIHSCDSRCCTAEANNNDNCITADAEPTYTARAMDIETSRERKQRESNDLVALAAARGPRYKVTSCRMGWVSIKRLSLRNYRAHLLFRAPLYFFALSHLQQSLFLRKGQPTCIRRACNLFTSFWPTNSPQIIHSEKVLLHLDVLLQKPVYYNMDLVRVIISCS